MYTDDRRLCLLDGRPKAIGSDEWRKCLSAFLSLSLRTRVCALGGNWTCLPFRKRVFFFLSRCADRLSRCSVAFVSRTQEHTQKGWRGARSNAVLIDLLLNEIEQNNNDVYICVYLCMCVSIKGGVIPIVTFQSMNPRVA